MTDTLRRDTVPTPATNGAENGNSGEHTSATTVVAAPSGTASRYSEMGEVQMLPPRRRRLRVVLPVLLLAALAVATLWYFVLQPPKSVRPATVQRGTIL